MMPTNVYLSLDTQFQQRNQNANAFSTALAVNALPLDSVLVQALLR